MTRQANSSASRPPSSTLRRPTYRSPSSRALCLTQGAPSPSLPAGRAPLESICSATPAHFAAVGQNGLYKRTKRLPPALVACLASRLCPLRPPLSRRCPAPLGERWTARGCADPWAPSGRCAARFASSLCSCAPDGRRRRRRRSLQSCRISGRTLSGHHSTCPGIPQSSTVPASSVVLAR